MTDVTKQLMCISLRNGIELWVEKERVEQLQRMLGSTKNNHFVDFDGETINTADLVGIFKAQTMADLTRRKNGQWQCKSQEWHTKAEPCDCWDRKERERRYAESAKKIREPF